MDQLTGDESIAGDVPPWLQTNSCVRLARGANAADILLSEFGGRDSVPVGELSGFRPLDPTSVLEKRHQLRKLLDMLVEAVESLRQLALNQRLELTNGVCGLLIDLQELLP